MPFDHYGMLAGTLTGHSRDDEQNPGRWYHVHLQIAADDRTYEAAVDVDSHQSTTGVQWKSLRVADGKIGPLPALGEGFVELAPTSTSGALDCIRHPALRMVGITRLLLWIFRFHGAFPASRNGVWIPYLRPWRSGDFRQATTALEAILTIGAEVMVWGEPYPDGSPDSAAVQGLHNVHQNQGDPPGNPKWWAEAGIWQDGGVAVRSATGDWRVFISKFTTQSFSTDAAGHPA